MFRCIRPLIWVPLVVSLIPGSAAAQPVTVSQLSGHVKLGETVSVIGIDGRHAHGRIMNLTAGSVTVSGDYSDERTFSLDEVQQVVGRGYFRENVNISVEEAWARFGTGNGWPTNETFFQGINAFTNNEVSRDTEINCIVLDGIEWLASPIALPVNCFPKNILGAKYYEDREVAFLASAFSSNALSGETATPVASDCDDSPPGPGRADQTVSRIIRDTKLARRVKALHRYRCQICNEILTLANGDLYAEAHHLQPLGGDHHGPDVIENIICVCPNHHALLDYFAISLSDIKIERHPEHSVGGVYLTFHNAQHQDRLSMRSA